MPGLIILLTVILFVSFLIARAILFRPPGEQSAQKPRMDTEAGDAAAHLSQLIQKRTVWSRNTDEIDTDEFRSFIALIEKLYPGVHKTLNREVVNEFALLYKWGGRESGNPAVLMAHYDVVSAEESEWRSPPFAGRIADGAIRGRGAIDTKGTLVGILDAAESLIEAGYTPKHDLYFSFANNEETAGDSTTAIVSLFRERDITPSFVLDEGGAVVEHVFPGVQVPVALVGVSEKGILDLEISVEGAGGHASAPPSNMSTIQLSEALMRLSRHPFPARLSQPTAEMFRSIGRYTPFGYRLIFANLWLFAQPLAWALSKLGGEMAAMVRTTVAVTQLQGSQGINVLASHAKAMANIRIAVGESPQGVIDRVNKRIQKTGATAKAAYSIDPSPVSATGGPVYDMLCKIIQDTFTPVVATYVMLGASDSRHFAKISGNVYRFTPYLLTKDERESIHGVNEELPVYKLNQCVAFYKRLIQNL